MWVMCVFFFKQKTAYEMRISDWSSDVCSSDLGRKRLCRDVGQSPARAGEHCQRKAVPAGNRGSANAGGRRVGQATGPPTRLVGTWRPLSSQEYLQEDGCPRPRLGRRRRAKARSGRSEEHTSELQSLMRISYAVFC